MGGGRNRRMGNAMAMVLMPQEGQSSTRQGITLHKTPGTKRSFGDGHRGRTWSVEPRNARSRRRKAVDPVKGERSKALFLNAVCLSRPATEPQRKHYASR